MTDTALSLRIASKREIAIDIWSFRLEAPDGSLLPEFTPGAHVGVMTPNGLLRKFSLCNSPADRRGYDIAVKRESSGRGSSSLIAAADVGDTLAVTAPRNNFALRPSEAGYLFIAGGIGITPILSMVRYLREQDRAPFALYYLTRSARHTAFRAELAELGEELVLHHDGGLTERMLDLWPVFESPTRQQVYCCGPRTLMREVQDMTGHWPSTAVHFEVFTEAASRRPEDTPFTVRLARSGDVVEIPVGATILETLRRAGHELRSSCESGTCGTCRTRLIAGEADHRDFVLRGADQATSIMICVSRARSGELVLDL
ncbi:MAG TPA: PDR/VanB family oxidoreductase [Gammaproteobacteria bacterium]|nr:PDR/VanB family oxidoreductase [Gammaproteobacteria bacterium]